MVTFFINDFKFTQFDRFDNFCFFVKEALIIVFIFAFFFSIFLSFLEVHCKHMPKQILIKILYKLIFGFNNNFACFTIGRVLWRLNVVCAINVAFDAMQKLIIIIKTYFLQTLVIQFFRPDC